MKTLFTEQEYLNAKWYDLLNLECQFCKKSFGLDKKTIRRVLNGSIHKKALFCSNKCKHNNLFTSMEVSCKNCHKHFFKRKCEIIKFQNHFCSHSCSATYNNLHKKTGTRRSKLESWIETKLNILYPNLKILYNNKTEINSELDIYIKSLNLAFELNEIYHYEPIHGQEKLSKVKNNDSNKFNQCYSKNISLCIIDTSSLSYFKEKNAQKYLDIVVNIINKTLSQTTLSVSD